MSVRDGRAVVRVDPPGDCGIADRFAGADLVDSYAVRLPADRSDDIRELAKAAFGDPPPWFRMLISIRDTAMGTLGLKTTSALREARLEVDRIDFFPVLSCTSDEIVLGEDDRHLDFRVSLLRRSPPREPSILIATTVVHCHNRIGRAYLATVIPFHGIVVRSSLRRA